MSQQIVNVVYSECRDLALNWAREHGYGLTARGFVKGDDVLLYCSRPEQLKGLRIGYAHVLETATREQVDQLVKAQQR